MKGFNYKTESFNQNNAYWLGFLANLAYKEKDEISNEVKKLNFTNKSRKAPTFKYGDMKKGNNC